MSNSIKMLVLGLSFALVLFVAAGELHVRAAGNGAGDGAYRQLGVYGEVLAHIRSEYVEEPNMTLVTDGAMLGLVESLDPRASFLSPADYKEYKVRTSRGNASIGAVMTKRFGYANVVSVLPGGPAAKAGIESGDILETVDGKATHEMSLAEVETKLLGQVGSNVTVSVVRARKAEPLKIVITRDVVSFPPVAEKMVEEGTGYLKVSSMAPGKSAEIANDLRLLAKSNTKRLILDLRDCADGDESEGIAAANLFLNHGVIASLEGQHYTKQIFNADPAKAVTDLPLVVMVNRGTAGAAELVASAVLENNRGDVVGDKTFGVASVQKLIEIPDGSALILSIAKYYSPSGKAIQDNAVTPSVLVGAKEEDGADPTEDQVISAGKPKAEAKAAEKDDEQLEKAIEVVKKRAAKA